MPIIKFAAIALISIVLAAGASACFGGGGDDSLTLQEYFEEYERLDNAADSRIEQLRGEYSDVLSATAVTDETRTRLSEFYDKQTAARREFLNGISKLEPPESALAAHNESVAAHEALVAASEPIAAALASARTIQDIAEVFDDQALNDALARTDQSCRALQALADGEDINVNLECA